MNINVGKREIKKLYAIAAALTVIASVIIFWYKNHNTSHKGTPPRPGRVIFFKGAIRVRNDCFTRFIV